MSWTLDNLDLVAELTLSHIRLSVVPIVLSFVIAVPLGWVANRNPTLRAVTISAGSLLYTIPSLPLFVILPYILGTRVLSEVNVLVALTIYGVAVMVRSAADALASVDKDTRQAATAVGYSSWTRFWRVELPLAGPVLLAGLRVVSVSTIALVSVGAIIGSRNLGYLIPQRSAAQQPRGDPDRHRGEHPHRSAVRRHPGRARARAHAVAGPGPDDPGPASCEAVLFRD